MSVLAKTSKDTAPVFDEQTHRISADQSACTNAFTILTVATAPRGQPPPQPPQEIEGRWQASYDSSAPAKYHHKPRGIW